MKSCQTAPIKVSIIATFILKVLVITGAFLYQFEGLSQSDSTRVDIHTESLKDHSDSLAMEELAPLDIKTDRGLYILTKDGDMQLRILGSIRFSVLYDFVNTPVKKTFNSYFVPIDDSRIHIPNYTANLNQSRFGFEVLRKLGDSDLFIRLEMDFNRGTEGNFRIRHAYGKYNKWLVGQTWSLFTNVGALPVTVNLDGPTGCVILRNPQIRYFSSNRRGTEWAFALEYEIPDIDLQEFDSSGYSTVQMLPDFTARVRSDIGFGKVQLSAILSTISVLDENDAATNVFGLGGSLSGSLGNSSSRILYQVTYGKSISNYITTFSGTGNDALINPIDGSVDPTISFAGYLGYDFSWSQKVSSNLVFGYANLKNRNYQSENAYSSSFSGALNTFWQVVPGARLGLEYMYNQRSNRNNTSGDASRISALFYYDF